MGHLPRNISTMCSILFGGVELITAQFQGDGNIQGIFHRVGWKFKQIHWKTFAIGG